MRICRKDCQLGKKASGSAVESLIVTRMAAYEGWLEVLFECFTVGWC